MAQGTQSTGHARSWCSMLMQVSLLPLSHIGVPADYVHPMSCHVSSNFELSCHTLPVLCLHGHIDLGDMMCERHVCCAGWLGKKVYKGVFTYPKPAP